jgi:superfamily I DNA/RNA helicase
VSDEELKLERHEHVQKIIKSGSRLKLIVAGPGTGKTTVFADVLAGDSKDNRVLTFIRNLVRDLDRALGEKAEVTTLHRYAAGVLHRVGSNGLANDFRIYPQLLRLLQADVEVVAGQPVDPRAVERAMHWFETDDGVEAFLRAANYYGAVDHTDAVYRLVVTLLADDRAIPEHRQIVVDELQDFSRVEVELIKLLSRRSPVIAAGDDDQALYAFKHASANFIREMATSGDWETFQLPFCSRCPPVIVEATNDLIASARATGLLQGRLDKRFECFLPDKRADGERYPRIRKVKVSVEKKGMNYAGRYIAQQILSIPDEDIEESHAANYPTALILGPSHLVESIVNTLADQGIHATSPPADRRDIDILDAYKILIEEAWSRLAWRIVMACDAVSDQDEILERALGGGADLRDLLDPEYVRRHLQRADLIAKVINGATLEPDEELSLKRDLHRSVEEVQKALGLLVEPKPEIDETKASVFVTNLLGAKGLSGGHVFVVGLNSTILPRNPLQPTDGEVCLMIVALTRTRKRCHLIHYGWYADGPLYPSNFLKWIQPQRYEAIYVDKDYIAKI